MVKTFTGNKTYIHQIITFFAASIILISTFFSSTAQENYFIGTLPSINFSKDINNKWSLYFYSEMRLTVTQDEAAREKYTGNPVQLTDFAAKTYLNTGKNSNVAIGYLIRFKDQLTYHRATQQFIIKSRYNLMNLSHRFLSDQTYNAVKPWMVRLRYKITSEIPLKNQSANSEGFFLKLGNEYLNTWIAGNPGLDIYIMPLAGYEFKNKNILQFGPEYWLTDIFNKDMSHVFWLNIGIFIKI